MAVLGLDPISLILGILIFLVFWKISQTSGNAGIINKLPGPPAFPIFGNILELLEPRHKALSNILERHKAYGPIFRVWLGSRPGVIFSKPEHLEVLLKSSRHTEKAFSYEFLHSWLGTGLLTSHGKKWVTHRKLITPTFHFKVLQGFVDVFQNNANILVEKLKPKAESGEEFDFYNFATLCTLDIICETAMGTKVNAQSEAQNQYVRSVYKLTTLIVHRMNRIWLHPEFIFKYSGTGKEYYKHLKIVHDFTNNVIKSRKEALKQKQKGSKVSEEETEERKASTFLDLLLESSLEGDLSLLSDEELREEVDTFMFEGHDTTASSISWAVFVLGNHPHIQEECYQELRTIFGDETKRTPTLSELSEMKYLDRVIKEALRLYPSVLSIARTMEEDAEFGEYVVPKDTTAVIGIYPLHRNPDIYPDPEKFDPDRFLPENIMKRHPYSYLPFSAGPRNCIGQKFALFEEKVVLSTLIRNYKFESMEGEDKVIKIPDLVLRPGSGIKVKISRR